MSSVLVKEVYQEILFSPFPLRHVNQTNHKSNAFGKDSYESCLWLEGLRRKLGGEFRKRKFHSQNVGDHTDRPTVNLLAIAFLVLPDFQDLRRWKKSKNEMEKMELIKSI